MNLHPHLHFLVTDGGVDEAGVVSALCWVLIDPRRTLDAGLSQARAGEP